MELTPDQQFFELVKKSRDILIALPEHLTADSLASGLALRLFLEKLQKNVVVASAGAVPESLKFLPGADFVKQQIPAGKSFVITVNILNKALAEISYQSSENQAQIFLKSQGEAFSQEDLSFNQEQSRVDLVIILGAKSQAVLGGLYEQLPNLFFQTPKINIDNQPDNEYFGVVNLVDITATSAAEVLAELLKKYEQQLVDEDIATCLLAGIISATRSFQHVQTTPKAFLAASELVALGGRQSQIVKQIYQTKSLPLLRLWGRALARMKIVGAEDKVIYSLLASADFEKAGGGRELLLPALAEFLENVSGYKIVALLAQTSGVGATLLAAVHRQLPIETLSAKFGGQSKILESRLGHYQLLEVLAPENTLEVLESRFLEALKSLPGLGGVN